MTEFSDQAMGAGSRPRGLRLRPLLLIPLPIAAILFQVYAPLFIEFLAFLELPLLVTVYFALMRRQPVWGLAAGCLIGLAQDAFSQNPIGLFGIVKTLVGYFAGSLSQRVDVENFVIRFLVTMVFFCFHHFLYWGLASALLGLKLPMEAAQTLVFGVLNAIVAVPLFGVLDKIH